MIRQGSAFLLLWLTWSMGCGAPVIPKIATWDVQELILFKSLTSNEVRSLPIDDLLKKQHVTIKDLRLRTLFQRAKFNSAVPVSKGKLEAIVKLGNGQYKRLWISYYGSFFGVIDQKRRGFFYFENADAKVWNELIFGNNLEIGE